MASHIEVSTSSPMGCVLKDHNSRRERKNANQNPNPQSQSNFQKNLKELVRDHLHSCISIPPRNTNSDLDENCNLDQSGSSGCWGGVKRSHQSSNNGGKHNRSAAPRNAKEMTTSKTMAAENRKQNQEAEVMLLSSMPSSTTPSPRETSPTRSDLDISVSSLVQKWREAEARSGRSCNIIRPCQSPMPESDVSNLPSRANSMASLPPSESGTEDRQGNTDECWALSECQSDKQQEGGEAEASSDGERERIRVADIVRKWAQTSQADAAAGDEGNLQHLNPFGLDLTWLKIGLDQGCPVICSTKIRGRQAIADLYMRMEKDRYKEVELLASRKAVSKFPQRGRIQALLKLWFLRREASRQVQPSPLPRPAERHDHRRPPLPRRADRRSWLLKPVESNSTETVSNITDLREKFNPVANQGSVISASTQKDTMKSKQETEKTNKSSQLSEQTSQNLQQRFNIKRCTIETIPTNCSAEVTTTCNQVSQQTCQREDINIMTHHTETPDNLNVKMATQKFDQQVHRHRDENNSEPQLHVSEEDSVSQNLNNGATEHPQQDLASEVNEAIEHPQEIASELNEENGYEITHGHQEENSSEPQLHASEEDSVNQNLADGVTEHPQQGLASEVNEGIEHPQEIASKAIWSDNGYESAVNLDMQGTAFMSHSGWEGDELVVGEREGSTQLELFEPNLEWIADIARPRSYWEDLRQAWYQEVFKTRSQDEEIRQLLERGSVSTVLASDFKERMDQLVMCSVQRAMHPGVTEIQHEDQSMRAFLDLYMPSFNHSVLEDAQQAEALIQEAEARETREVDDRQNEVVDIHEEEDNEDQHCDPTPSRAQFRWDQYEDQEVSDDSYNAPSTSLRQPSPMPSFDCDTHGSSPFKNSTVEMELIYDLRTHMEQLYQEMSELRKSIASCMKIQVKMQHSIKEEVSAAINNPKKREKEKDLNRRHPKMGNCSICYEKNVDSLLYRCGHMCTCFNCAHELQWSYGKCPICRAKIIDVVRAYPDN